MCVVDEDEPLRGEYLRLVCIALQRNRVGGLKKAAIVLPPEVDPIVEKAAGECLLVKEFAH